MKTEPYKQNGLTGFTNEHGERVCTGSQMGRRSIIPPGYAGERLNLRRVPFVDGAYDQGGAYWGSPANLWCAWGETATEQLEIYVRAAGALSGLNTRHFCTPNQSHLKTDP